MENPKFTNLHDTTSGSVPRCITKKWIEVPDQSGGSYITNKQIRFKTSCYNQIYVITVMHILLSKGTINVKKHC